MKFSQLVLIILIVVVAFWVLSILLKIAAWLLELVLIVGAVLLIGLAIRHWLLSRRS